MLKKTEKQYCNSYQEQCPFARSAKGCSFTMDIGFIQLDLGQQKAHRDEDHQSPESNGEDVRGS